MNTSQTCNTQCTRVVLLEELTITLMSNYFSHTIEVVVPPGHSNIIPIIHTLVTTHTAPSGQEWLCSSASLCSQAKRTDAIHTKQCLNASCIHKHTPNQTGAQCLNSHNVFQFTSWWLTMTTKAIITSVSSHDDIV